MGRTRIIIFILLVFSFVSWPSLTMRALAATAEEQTAAALVEGAKKEGKVVWYTMLTTAEADTVAKKFREKYPFIVPEMYRAGAEKMLTRILAENQAKRHIFDTLMITQAESEILNRKGLFTKYQSPQRKFYPEGLKDADGHWTDLYLNLNVIGYNTKMVSPREVPRTLEDLLKPRWKGKMGMDTKAYTWFASVLKQMGEKRGLEYMKKLGEQNILFRTGRTLNAQMVAAGETDIGIALYNQRIEEMKAKGAPVNWVAIEPVVPEIHPLAISAYAPHPNAARLLVDYLLSKEGQGVIASFFRIPSRADVDPLIPAMKKGLKIMPPDFSMVDNYDKYTRLYRELLMRQ